MVLGAGRAGDGGRVTAMHKAASALSPRLDATAPADHRDAQLAKPLLRGWLHLAWFEASLVLGTLALSRMHGGLRITALAIFEVSVTAMFGVSALYHRGDWGATWRPRLQRLDHAMIFLLIAGTATAAFLLTTHGPFRIVCLIAICTPGPRRERCCSRAACCTSPEPSPTAAAAPTRTRRSSATTRSFTSTCAPRRPASSSRSLCSSRNCSSRNPPGSGPASPCRPGPCQPGGLAFPRRFVPGRPDLAAGDAPGCGTGYGGRPSP